MKSATIFLLTILISFPALSQGRKYQKGMRKALEQMEEAADRESILRSVSTFEQFAQDYPDQWIPLYYASQILITTSFEESDPDARDDMLARAKKSLDACLKLVPEESEVKVIEALYYIGMMGVDPEIRGPQYFEDANWALERARELNPDNPRAVFLDGMMALNLPDFMGGGPAAAKPIFLEARKKFEAFHNDDPLWPSWGPDVVEEELEKLVDIEINE